jgi:hypothetical protein
MQVGSDYVGESEAIVDEESCCTVLGTGAGAGATGGTVSGAGTTGGAGSGAGTIKVYLHRLRYV